jgi:hypothetical protein
MDQPVNRSWWSRNWKWVLPVGCLTPLVLCCGGVAIIASVIFGTLKSSDVYTEALAAAKSNDEVKALLGEPIEAGMWVLGEITLQNNSGSANLTIPISGPKGSATVDAAATKVAGKWTFSVLEVTADDGNTHINLRQKVEKEEQEQ